MARHPIVAEDCEQSLAPTASLWPLVAGRRIFLTGGTGFFGTWFLELLTHAADARGFDCEVVVLSRDPARFARSRAGHLASHRSVRMLRGDVLDFAFPPGHFDYVAHFGSTGPKKFHDEQPKAFFDFVVNGTRRVLDFAVAAGASRFLLASTGAVYGRGDTGPVAEDSLGALNPLPAGATNAEAKRMAEILCARAHREHPMLAPVSARGFAFIGPYLPVEANFAASDFIQEAIAGRDIVVAGDGTPVRTYMYGSDLAIWLWTLLLRAPPDSAYNVGSENPVTIRQLAEKIAAVASPSISVRVRGAAIAGAAPSWYVPSTAKARRELNLAQMVSLEDAIARTVGWYRSSDTT